MSVPPTESFRGRYRLSGLPKAVIECWTTWIDSHAAAVLSLIALLYFLGFGALAYSSALTSDDIFSLYVSQAGSVSRILAALSHGADTHPPLHYVMLHAAHLLLGDSDFVGRLPFLFVGFLTVVILFLFIRQRFSAIYGLVTVTFLLLTMSAHAVISTRPYPLMMCAYMLALWFWQRSMQSSRRMQGLIGLGVTTALAILSHFYGGLVVLPIAVGEAWRSWRTRRIQVGVWVAMAAGALPLVFLLPQVRTLAATIGSAGLRHPGAVTSPTVSKLVTTYTTSLQPTLLIVGVGCLVLFPVFVCTRGIIRYDRSPPPGFYPEELAGIATLILMPLILYVLGLEITGVYAADYGYMETLGVSLLITHLLFVLFQANRAPVAVLAGCLLLIFALEQARFAQSWRPRPWNRFQISSLLTGKEAAGSMPIVVTHVVPFLQSLHYAPADLQRRLNYLVDVEQADRFGDPSPDIALQQLRPWVDVPIEQYQAFVRTHSSFLVYEWGWIPGWLVTHLREQHANIQILAVEGPHRLLLVTLRLLP